jgi:hypothetical protein
LARRHLQQAANFDVVGRLVLELLLNLPVDLIALHLVVHGLNLVNGTLLVTLSDALELGRLNHFVILVVEVRIEHFYHRRSVLTAQVAGIGISMLFSKAIDISQELILLSLAHLRVHSSLDPLRLDPLLLLFLLPQEGVHPRTLDGEALILFLLDLICFLNFLSELILHWGHRFLGHINRVKCMIPISLIIGLDVGVPMVLPVLQMVGNKTIFKLLLEFWRLRYLIVNRLKMVSSIVYRLRAFAKFIT